MSTLVEIRFLVFPTGRSFHQNLDVALTWGQAKLLVFQKWNQEWGSADSSDSMKFIHAGRVLADNTKIEEVATISTESIVTVHVVVKKTQPQVTPTNAHVVEETATAQQDDIWDSNIHFHGCTFSEEEVSELRFVFSKRKGDDGKMTTTDVNKFLQHYWKWMKQQKYKDTENFPVDELQRIQRRILSPDEQRVTCDQFLQIFFLFDNHTPDDCCPHGAKSRVERATQELHKCVKPDSQFASQIFDTVFRKIDADNDGTLSCKEVELFFLHVFL